MQLLQSTPCTAPFTVGSMAMSSARRGLACRAQATRKQDGAVRYEGLSRRQASGALFAAFSLAAIQGPVHAANAFLSPEARSKELAKKESRRKAELKEKYAKMRASEGGEPAPSSPEQSSG
ncbi:g12596 [Coccomyxa viridis]|uniref:G12596 protein n=1 Tax=Coccomyxa viridis TaxID=1274662 RepID=A0ABP1GG94_9CHLO